METEKFELMLDEAQANAALEKGMLYADTFVNKNYLINLDRYPLVELDPAEKSDEYIRLYQIERIVYDVDENANDKLISVYSAFFNIQAAGLLVIKSTRNALGFYIGVRSVDNTSTAEAILEKSFKGNFAGSQIQAIPQEEVQKVLGSINKSGRFGTRQNVSSVSIVPSTRDEDKERFVQGIEKFIDTMKGSEYTAVFIAEPLDKEILEQRKRGLQKIYSGLSPFASTQLSYGENYSKAVSKGMSENFSKTLNDSLTDTTSHFNSRSTSRSHGTSFGFLGIGFNNSTSTGYSSGSSWASAVTRGTSETKGETVTETDTDTTGDSRTITVTSENKSVKYILEKIDQHLARIKNCEAFGLWDIACYFVSENVQTSVVAASTYKASLTDRQLNRFEQLLLETPGAAPIATRLCARKIASSKNPEDEFWRFYDNQRSRISANSGFTIEPMILACINNVDAKIREDVAIDILRKINASVINDGETIMVLTNAVNDCSVKELSKMDSAFLQRVCQIRAKVDKSGLEKIKAVFIGEMLTANNAQRKRPVNLSGELAQTGISLKSVEKSDYEAYIKNYFDEYFVLLQASEDVPALMRIFYHGRYFSNFIDDYISVLKKKAKKETERWKRILGWTCVYLVTAERSDQAAEELYKPIVRYLRSLDEDGLLDVRQAVIKDIPSSRCDYLFDEVRRKEGLAEKLGGFFHKK